MCIISWQLTVDSLQSFLAYKSKIKIQKSAPESFARTGEAIVNQIRAFVAISYQQTAVLSIQIKIQNSKIKHR